jgi:hypothetical protein
LLFCGGALVTVHFIGEEKEEKSCEKSKIIKFEDGSGDEGELALSGDTVGKVLNDKDLEWCESLVYYETSLVHYNG